MRFLAKFLKYRILSRNVLYLVIKLLSNNAYYTTHDQHIEL